MGYTHYFTIVQTIPTEKWNQIVEKTKEIAAKYKDILANGYGELGTEPEINNERISFNGIEDDSHETLYLTRELSDFQFCKTAFKPYDAAVVEIMQCWLDIAPECFNMSSDGDEEDKNIFEIKEAVNT